MHQTLESCGKVIKIHVSEFLIWWIWGTRVCVLKKKHKIFYFGVPTWKVSSLDLGALLVTMGDGYNLGEVLLWELYRYFHYSHYKLFYFIQNPRPKNNRENFSSIAGGGPWPLITHLSGWPSSTHLSYSTAWLCIVSERLKASLRARLPAEMEALATFMLPIGVGTYLTCFIFNWYSLLCF